MGIEEVLIAPLSPWQDPFIERLIGLIRRECLGHVLVINEAHLLRAPREYFANYHESRPHQSLARTIHEGPTAAAHLRALEREIVVRLLDVLPSTSFGGALRKESEYADFSSQSTHLHALARTFMNNPG
ncbi:MAG: transposase [Deltaproteobacteria bacterium]|nr:transposase [Deltaproteobacteria bacterium]